MKRILYVLPLMSLFVGCATLGSSVSENKSQIFFNGDIITMAGDKPNYVQSILVENGKIAFVGSLAKARSISPNSSEVNLKGKTLLPGFIDAHGHAYSTGLQAVATNLYSKPDGNVNNIPQLIQSLKSWKLTNQQMIDKHKWIIGFGYDDAQLKENRHPTADDLDLVSTDIPVMVVHQSGHLGAMNHKALELIGYNANTPDPSGGVIRRKNNSKEPNGVLEEKALAPHLHKLMSTFDENENENIALSGVQIYLKYGFTTLQEGRTSAAVCEAWKRLGQQQRLPVDLACYPDLQSNQKYLETNGVQKTYTNHFRIAGVKLALDGSPQGRTAWLTEPYLVPPNGQKQAYTGYPAVGENAFQKLVDTAYKNKWQILTHANGDAALDEYLYAIDSATQRYGATAVRNVAIHAQTARYDQLDTMKKLNIIPSFFSMHTYYWGDWHRDVTLGKERAYRISPAQTALNKGMIFTQHHDSPVILPNSLMILHTAVNRVSRTGDVIGPQERISPYHALMSITNWAAYQYSEDDIKGTLEKGKLADIVILDKNPLKVNPMEIKNIQVLQTLKEGNTVYMKVNNN